MYNFFLKCFMEYTLNPSAFCFGRLSIVISIYFIYIYIYIQFTSIYNIYIIYIIYISIYKYIQNLHIYIYICLFRLSIFLVWVVANCVCQVIGPLHPVYQICRCRPFHSICYPFNVHRVCSDIPLSFLILIFIFYLSFS